MTTVRRGNVFLGMRRLSIIDLSGGRQSMWNADQSCCALYNGELQNFLELRPGLGLARSLFPDSHAITQQSLNAHPTGTQTPLVPA